MSAALFSYPHVCEEVLLSEVRSRLVAQVAATKVDLAALAFWKHIKNARWITKLSRVPDTTVREVTAAALGPGLTDEERLLGQNRVPLGCHAAKSTDIIAPSPPNPDLSEERAQRTSWPFGSWSPTMVHMVSSPGRRGRGSLPVDCRQGLVDRRTDHPGVDNTVILCTWI